MEAKWTHEAMKANFDHTAYINQWDDYIPKMRRKHQEKPRDGKKESKDAKSNPKDNKREPWDTRKSPRDGPRA